MKFFSGTKGNSIFWVIVFLLFAFFALEFGLGFYEDWSTRKAFQEFVQKLEDEEKERQEKMTADKIGGSTPQETLQMFIDAVEAGNYELASKYFVVERQGEELQSLQDSPKENIDNVMRLLKDTKNDMGEYSSSQKSFSVYKPILVNFILYPSGNWKIEKI